MCVRFFHMRSLRCVAKAAPAAALAALLTASKASAQEAPDPRNPGDAPPTQDAPHDAPPTQGAPHDAPPTQDAPHDAPPPPDAPPTTPGAEAADRDVVYATDGRVLRGTVVLVVPDVEVQIRLASGELVTVPRREILHFEHVAQPPEEPPWASALSARLPAVGWVHITGSDVAALERAGEGLDWTMVCTSPCDKALPTRGVYRIVGPDLKTSHAFSLNARNGEYETLRVHAASRSATTRGIVILAVGVPLSLTVAFTAVASAIGSGARLSSTARTVEQTSLLAGGLATLFGVGLLLTNLSTVVSQYVVPTTPTTPAGSPYGAPRRRGRRGRGRLPPRT